MPTSLITPILDGRDCPDSVGGVHAWAYADSSWGNARYIDDWIYASAKLEGNNQTIYPLAEEEAAVSASKNLTAIIVASVVSVLVVAGIVAAIIIRRNRNRRPPQLPPPPPAPGDPNITSL